MDDWEPANLEDFTIDRLQKTVSGWCRSDADYVSLLNRGGMADEDLSPTFNLYISDHDKICSE